MLRHLSVSTEKTYTHWLGRYGAFLREQKVLPGTTEGKMEAFLTRLARTGMSAATQNQAFNALLFFYREVLKQEIGPVDSLRAKRAQTIRYCPSQAEVSQLLAAVSDLYSYPTRLIAHLLYACGLRVSEPLNLRIKDVDLKESRLYVHQSKGNKGRVVLFPNCLKQPLEQQLLVARDKAAKDRTGGIPVALPGLLAKKYPWAARSERWAWLFPSHTVCRDPRTHQLVRWRCHEGNVQRALKQAAVKCRLEGVTPHCLRHAFATHTLHGGAFVRDLQVVLGHNHLETTMLYLHTEAGRVASPLNNYAPVPNLGTMQDSENEVRTVTYSHRFRTSVGGGSGTLTVLPLPCVTEGLRKGWLCRCGRVEIPGILQPSMQYRFAAFSAISGPSVQLRTWASSSCPAASC